MPRWQPNARERLEQAAINLFAERGYEATTVEEISAAAGLSRSTFFRYYSDKRDIFSGGNDGLAHQFAHAVERAPAEAKPVEAIRTAFRQIAQTWFSSERRELASVRAAVIAANPSLREREFAKRAAITDGITAALISRGADVGNATVAATLATLAFSYAVPQWADPASEADFDSIANRLLQQFLCSAAELR